MNIDRYFLKDLELIFKKHDFLKSKTEKFNIFSVLYKDHEEKRLHSRFIAALLDPFASHEKSYIFLNEFLDLFPKILKKGNFKNAIVYPEEWNKKENKNIDILIIDSKTQNAIIIENKINAKDSNNENGGQLERYFKYVRDDLKIKKENITTFYLTLDEHEPSKESLGKFSKFSNINGQCISYNLILKWINICIKYVADKPFIRESLIQYKNIIKRITMNETDINERHAIIKSIAKDNTSMKSTKYLIDNFKHVKWHTVDNFWKELSIKLQEQNFIILEEPTEQNITDITHFETYRKGQKEKQDCGIWFKVNDNLKIFIWNEADEWIYWGTNSKKVGDKYHKIFNDLTEQNFFELSEAQNWWKFCLNNDDERIWLSNFSHQATFDLINPQLRNEKINVIIKEIITFLKQNIITK